MKLSVWENGQLIDATFDELKAIFNRPTWINVNDPSLEDLSHLSEVLGMPLIEKLRSNYPHSDSYKQYTKIFSWYLTPSRDSKEFSFFRSPVVILTNKIGVITLSSTRSGIEGKVAEKLESKDLLGLSIPAIVTYIVFLHMLEAYEQHVEEFERYTDRLEVAIPPWPKKFYAEAFHIRRDVSNLLRILRHFRITVESLTQESSYKPFNEEERRMIDTIYDRAVGIEEMAEMTLETIRDRISLHMDTLSHDMNKAMRLMAAITAIVALPSVIGSLFGMNLIDNPWPWELWKVSIGALSLALVLIVYFIAKGWLSDVD
jgi:magnesium transporter